jgi:hypothetical protein
MTFAEEKREISEAMVLSTQLWLGRRMGRRFVLIFPPKLYINNWVGKEMEPARSRKRKTDG